MDEVRLVRENVESSPCLSQRSANVLCQFGAVHFGAESSLVPKNSPNVECAKRKANSGMASMNSFPASSWEDEGRTSFDCSSVHLTPSRRGMSQCIPQE